MERNGNRRILFVDDDAIISPIYIQELKLAGYDVEFYQGVDSISTALASEQRPHADLFIIDVMMPPEKSFANEPTNGGLLTGLFLAQEIRKTFSYVPVILLSSMTFDSVRKSASQFAMRLENCILLEKRETNPFALVGIVDQYFKEFVLESGQKSSVFSRLFKSLLLQPNFYGVGIDLKKLGNDADTGAKADY